MEAEGSFGEPPTTTTNPAGDRALAAGRLGESGVRIEIDGLVQGVGFRPWIYTVARAAGLHGRVWNHSAGVTVEVFGESDSLRSFVEQLARPPMPAAYVRGVWCEVIAPQWLDSFEIVASRGALSRQPSIPPDLAICDDCRHELLDPTDRRHGYAFINCTRCGPRYTICDDVPYDRPRTTMAEFPMCDRCRKEYENPLDRRFHAQPNACPTCGPRLNLVDAKGQPLPGDPIATAASLLCDGRIVAVKGLGGYHLACDATNAAAVATLRSRKHRDAKPFAVMVRDLAAAGRLTTLTPAEQRLLAAASRPIVLVARQQKSSLAVGVAPGNPLVGVMLPYTPLHELLLTAVDRPLVMTSGNRSDEPMVCDDDEALLQLASVADAFLQHNRPIANRCDDSVARVIGGRPVILRRSRGWVPGNLPVGPSFPAPILACGAHLKNAFCLGVGNLAWLGPHVGDLETDEACRAFEAMVDRFQRFVGTEPEVVAHDLHPDYFTTRWAAELDQVRVAVQHHHAHVASAMAEHHLDGPVIGLAWDGTGYGDDGTAWGGELLVAGFADFRRFATFRPIALAGGDQAIRETWRIALALLDDAFDGDPPLDRLSLFDQVQPARIAAARQMVTTRLHAPLAHGVGRYFDAFGALVLGHTTSRYEGEVAMQLGFAADPVERRAYRFDIAEVALNVVDLRPAVRAAVADLLAGTAATTIAARFHATLVEAAIAMIQLAAGAYGALPVVLSGGCFQNSRLVEDLTVALEPRFRVYAHEQVPPNDGGIALGQAMVAAARLRGESGLCGGTTSGGM